MKYTPFNDNIIVRKTDKATESKGGIVLPSSAVEDDFTGTVISIGEKVSINVNLGDTVRYNQYAGSKLDIEGLDCLIMPEKEVICKVEH